MGSFLLPNDPASKSEPPLAGSWLGSAAATRTSTARTTAVKSGRARAGAPPPRPPQAPRAPAARRGDAATNEARVSRGSGAPGVPPPAPGRDSRRLRIAMHRGVDVAQQPHVLRAHLDFHAAAAHVERASSDGHVARRGD